MVYGEVNMNNGIFKKTDQAKFVELCGGSGNEDYCLSKVTEMLNEEKLEVRINEPLPLGDTPLTKACREGNLKIVKFLLDNNANPLTRNNCNETPYQVAKNEKVKEILDDAMILSKANIP